MVSYTDALIESFDSDGDAGRTRCAEIVRLLGDGSRKTDRNPAPRDSRSNPKNLSDDDVTVLVVRANGRQPRHSFVQKLKAMLRKVGGSPIRSIDPRAERAPLDANLANIEARLSALDGAGERNSANCCPDRTFSAR